MKCVKKGRIFKPNPSIWWQYKYAILPTPVYLEKENILRIFFASVCKSFIGRISFIDVNPQNPKEILYKHNSYIVDVGKKGSFDENGMNPSSIIFWNNKWYLYYVGYQRHHSSPYSLFTGLLISEDCIHFERYSDIPILERKKNEINLRSAASVMIDENIFKVWYVADNGWKKIISGPYKNKLLPTYSIKFGVSNDGISWVTNDRPLLELRKQEFGFGRPFVIKDSCSNYRLFYSVRSTNLGYRLGFAESQNGLDWIRKDKSIGIDVSKHGWDSKMICYCSVIKILNKTFMFFNGNGHGENGFGYAEIIEW
ncbi:MAG: hypothetical protein IAE65_06355 [Ignavibacteria bacterium]|nr:hypothetical protein [Ignavibacteria bacterium]